MRNVFVFLLLFVSFNLIAQSEVGAKEPVIKIKDSRWKSNFHCFASDSVHQYTLTKMTDYEYNWGNFISFEDSTFHTDYSAPCGLDCFTNVYGTYKFVGHNEIEVYVKTMTRNGLCNTETGNFVINQSFGVFRFETNADGSVVMIQKD